MDGDLNMNKIATSNIVAKFQTTVPSLVRDIFDLKEGDILKWEFDSQHGILIVQPMRANPLTARGESVIRKALQTSSQGRTRPLSPAQLKQAEKTEVR